MSILISVLTLLIPGVVAGVVSYYSNKLFYQKVKTELDKDIERHKISYGGIFKERVEIYRGILKHLTDVRTALTTIVFSSSEEDAKKAMITVNDFNSFLRVNRPFLTQDLIIQISNLTGRYRDCLDNLTKHAFVSNHKITSEKIIKDVHEGFIYANSLLNSTELVLIEDQIVRQMRNDLQMS